VHRLRVRCQRFVGFRTIRRTCPLEEFGDIDATQAPASHRCQIGPGGIWLSVFAHDRLAENGLAGDRARRSRRSHRVARAVATLTLSAFTLPALLILVAANRAQAADFAGYVKSTALNVRAEPGAKSSIAGILLKFDPVTVTGERNVGQTRWYSITASGGYVAGWVAARFIARGEAPASTQEADIDYGAHETPTLMRGQFKYVGVSVCADCHTESTGDFDKGAVQVWQGHFHAQAHKTLQRDYTQEIASRTRGVEDPANDWRCVKCHQAAFGAGPEQTASSYRAEEGVTCEVCHGPGSAYAEEDHGPEIANREAMGFRVLRNLSDRREVCTSCHNNASPTFIGFDLREFSRKIAHWVDEDDAAYYAEYDIEAERRADRVAETEKTPTTSTAAKKAAKAAAVTAAASATAAAAAEAAKSDADATKAASEAAANAASLKADEARASADAAKATTAKAAAAEREAAERKQAKAAANAEAAEDEAARKAAQARADTEAAAKAEEARQRKAAVKAAAEAKSKAAAEAAAATAAAAVAKPSPAADPLAHYLEDVDDVIRMNTNGKKYKKVKFPHRKHATGLFYSEMTCQTCHHTQEDDDSPVACNECHDIDGDADEEKTKKRYVHAKGLDFPKEPDQEQVSCVSCHKAMNALLADGEREGEKAPVKCTKCHARNK
jgi:uncharacterized protein YgiM (DUF1202 family)